MPRGGWKRMFKGNKEKMKKMITGDLNEIRKTDLFL